MDIDLSIIIPCYNEGNKLVRNLYKLKAFLNCSKIYNHELIIVNDGSTDSTDRVCKQLKLKNPNLKYITYDKNRGKGYAVKEGISNSIGKIVLFMDADFSTDLSAITKVMNINKKDHPDVIIASRKLQDSVLVKKQGFIRRIIGNTCSFLTNLIIPLNIKDTQCGFKAFEGNFARDMVKYQTLNGFAFDVEYLYIAKLNNKEIVEFGAIWDNDDDSKVSVIKSSIRFFNDLFKIKRNKKKYKMGN